MSRSSMRRAFASNESGFTLLEVLIAMAIFAIGSLGVLSMMMMSTDLNRNSRQSQEALLVSNWLLEQMQVRSLSDAQISGCATNCWATISDLKKASAATVSVEELSGAASTATGARYQAAWITDSPQSGLRHYRVTVMWPKDSTKQTLQGPGDPSPDAGFLDCTGAGQQCMRVETHTYRRIE